MSWSISPSAARQVRELARWATAEAKAASKALDDASATDEREA